MMSRLMQSVVRQPAFELGAAVKEVWCFPTQVALVEAKRHNGIYLDDAARGKPARADAQDG